MSHHIREDDDTKWVFGWDHPLMSFFLQVHDKSLDEENDEDPVIARYGSTAGTIMYEVEDLERMATKHGLNLSAEMKAVLYGDKDDGR